MESSSSTKSRTESRTTTRNDLTLRIIEGKLTGQLVKLSATRCTIGSGSHCTLRLRGRNVAAVECEISRSKESNIIRCQSSNTILNGQSFQLAELYNGDILTVGPITFEIIKGATDERNALRQEIRSQISTTTLSASASQAQVTELPIEQSNYSITNPSAATPTEELLRTANELQSSISREEQTLANWQGFGHHTTDTFANYTFADFLNPPAIDSNSNKPLLSQLTQPDLIPQKNRIAIGQDEHRNAFAAQSEEITIREIENNARTLENNAEAEVIAAHLQELTAREAAINAKTAECIVERESLIAQIEQLEQDRDRLAGEQQKFLNDQQQLEVERAQLRSYLDSYENERAQLAAEQQVFDEANCTLIEERKQWLTFAEKTRIEHQHIENELQQRADSLSAIEANLEVEKSEIAQTRETLAIKLTELSQSEIGANRWHTELANRAHALSRYTTTIKAKSNELALRQQSLQAQEQRLHSEVDQLQTKRQVLDAMFSAVQSDREQFEIERTKVTFQQSTLQDQIVEQRDLVAAQWADLKRNEQNTAREKTDLQKRQVALENEYRTKLQQLDQRETELATRLASINSDRQSLTTREEELRQLEHALNRQASNTASTSEEITTDLLRLDSERKAIQNQIVEIEQKRSDAQNEVEKLESFRKAFADERLQWEEQQASWQAERIRYEEKLVAFDTEQRNIDARFQELESESVRLEQERAEMQKIIDERNEIERESLELKQAIEILEHRRNSLDSELTDIQEKRPELAQTLAELKRATAELNEISTAAREIQSALVATTSEYTEKQSILLNLESELSRLHTAIANLRVEQDRLTAENAQTEELQAEEALAQRLHAEEALTQRLKAEQALTHHSAVHFSNDHSIPQNDDHGNNEPAPSAAAAKDDDAIFERLKNFSLLKSTTTEPTQHDIESTHEEVEQDEPSEPAQNIPASDVLSAFREQFAQEIAQESNIQPEPAIRNEPVGSKRSQSSSAQSGIGEPVIQTVKEAKADDDSIDDYMQQLLQRMRGSNDAQGSSGISPVIERRDRDSSKQQNPQAEQRRTSDSNSTSATQEDSADSIPAVPKPRREPSKASDQNIDMSAMREIANFSARSAVNRSMSKRTASKVLQHVMVGGAALAMSAVVLYIGQDGNQLINTVGYAGLGLSAAWLAYALFVSRKLIFGEFTMSSLIEASDVEDESNVEPVADVDAEAAPNATNLLASLKNEPVTSNAETEPQVE